MCGILVHKGKGNNFFIQKRGQDATVAYRRNGYEFIHNLLNVTGSPNFQPFINKDVVIEYNGEIYNQPYLKSDGECLIPLYKKYGIMFPQELDGEFAIAVYDFKRDWALFITDPFATKPLWRNGTECASYESGVGGHKIKANTIEVVSLSSGELIETINYHEWSWNQYNNSYDRCLEALEKAILKRYKPGCFIGLSSGYDSGTISTTLNGLDYKAYVVKASENMEVLRSRWELARNYQVIDSFDILRQEEHLKNNAEEFFYNIRYDDRICNDSYKNDYAAKALSHICELAHNEGRKVYLSGSGADEILSDYSLIPNQSEFKGIYPDELKEWSNFTGSCMYSYLGKEECVGGSWSIETRYPFLDKNFVQEFLSLTPELKNRNYKAPLYEYLTKRKYPFDKNKKIGFSV